MDCVPAEEVRGQPFAEGPWCWLLENLRPLPTPIPYRGAQMLWDVPDEFVRNPAGYLMRECN